MSGRQSRLQRSRRAFMRTVGGAATALPFYRLLESSAAFAAPGDQPQRFISMYLPHGIAAPLFNRQPGDTDTAFNLKFADSVLAPFDDAATYGTSFTSKVTVIEGMDLAAGVDKGTNGHDASCIILTGSAPTGQNTANESLDQFLAVTKGLGAQTRITSLVLGVGNKETVPGRNMSYGKSGAPLSKIIDPAETFRTLFGGGAVVGGDPAAAALAERARLRKQSILDNVKAEINRLHTRLAAPEKLKMDQHLTAVRELEKQIQALPVGGGGGVVGGGCNAPAAPNSAEFPMLEAYNGGVPYLDKIIDLQVDLMAQAMACDLTRFATLFIFYAAGAGVGMGDLTQAEDIHNKVAHQYQASNPASVQNLGRHNRYYFAKCARLMQRLTEAGIIDSTLLYACSDMGDPNAHSLRGVPTLLAGGANGKIKMGRRLVARQSNNKLLVSIANAFDVPITTYGSAKPEITDGALTELA